MSLYKLRCCLLGHEKDVRALCPSPQEGSIISGSRDVTARTWVPNESNNGFTEGSVLTGHSGFVASVCIIPPNDENPQGLIATGSNDTNIHVYNFESPFPIYKLEGHKDTVCSLSSGKFGTLMSGSWDKTAKVWLKQKQLMTLTGHSLAVWCVAVMPENGYMVTGSADKLIKVWKAGKCEQTLKGHDDCVRGLTVLDAQEFLSCSNDSTIRRWSISGHVLQVYYSHTNYVYSIARLPNSTDFASVGEDRSVKIWRNGECVQTITHPCTSVWSVCVLENGDVVTGSSDSMIRVFTTDESRQASAEEIKSFEQQVSSSQIPTQVGDIDSSKLPGPEILLAPGKKDGAVQMVKIGSDVEAHQWSAAEQQWTKVGDVVGSSGGTANGRTLHEGKEYDFVFSVDIAEGEPPLKLPYNMTEDPWVAAQNFITKNALNQAFLEQVRDFIVQNTQSVSMNQVSADSNYRDPFTGSSGYVPGSSAMDTSTGGGYADPFTGGGRYIPGAAASNVSSGPALDPFTGSASYRTQAARSAGDGSTSNNPYFPLKEVVTFNNFNKEGVIKKLKEFNKLIPGSARCVEGDLEAVVNELSNIEKTPTAEMLTYLYRLIQWPKDQAFPAIDVMRAALRNPTVNEYFCNSKDGANFLQIIVAFLDADQPATNQMVALRAMANICVHKNGQDLMLANCENLIPLVAMKSKSTNKNIEIASATVLMNIAVLLKPTDDNEAGSHLLSALITAADNVQDPEAQYRICVGLGTLLWNDDNNKALAKSMGIESRVNKWKLETGLEKLKECGRYLDSTL